MINGFSSDNITKNEYGSLLKSLGDGNYRIGIRDRDKYGSGFLGLTFEDYIDYCKDNGLDPQAVINYLLRDIVYVLHDNGDAMDYFILWNNDESLNYGLKYRG